MHAKCSRLLSEGSALGGLAQRRRGILKACPAPIIAGGRVHTCREYSRPSQLAHALIHEAEQLYDALNRLIRVHQFRDRDRICGRDISVAQCYALETLIKQGPLRSRDLAARMFLDKSTASRVVDALVRKGHAQRTPDHRDRRAVQVVATAHGQALYRHIRGELVADHRALIEQLPAEVRAAAVDLLAALTEHEVIRTDEPE